MDRTIKEIKGLLWALIFALLIRTFLFQPFNIPSGSMYPTLMVGDYIFVTKYSYGFSKYSFPFAIAPLSNRIAENRKPEVGEVVVFTNPKDTSMDYIKRLVGLPGDRIQVKAGVLHINGEPVKLEKTDDYPMIDYRTQQLIVVPQYIETLPNGKQHKILKAIPFGQGALDNTEEYIVPAGHYFMMGDNRDNSQDSRVLDKVGYIPEEYLIGPAKVIFFSTEAKWFEPNAWISGIRPKRVLTMID
ncbi:signal peptidase I [Candidatus Paracaedibacter symbiosus]|uniref:signal peptidase I n=1 Tax=Candidatus Paracaedibacter symbiosus TaxID=244582 RepID=UPI000509D7DE|nr:signal peptidase I [Candidatus Paracaedibacter symbiosus]